MPLSEQQISERLPLWTALSDLFLDTELTESTYKYIARTLCESGFTFAQVEQLLWQEVFPALVSNLQQPAGEWAGFSGRYLRDAILQAIERPFVMSAPLISRSAVQQIIAESWAQVCVYLPEDYLGES